MKWGLWSAPPAAEPMDQPDAEENLAVESGPEEEGHSAWDEEGAADSLPAEDPEPLRRAKDVHALISERGAGIRYEPQGFFERLLDLFSDKYSRKRP